jgi:hypothetical protein
MSEIVRSIPRPLVQTNQLTIVISVIVTWVFQFEWFLLIPLLAGLSGIFLDFNPIMQVAKRFLREKPETYIPEDWKQQQFNQKIAVFCLTAGFFSFLLGWETGGYAFTILVAVAATVALLGFCIGCFIHYQWKLYMYRKTKQ